MPQKWRKCRLCIPILLVHPSVRKMNSRTLGWCDLASLSPAMNFAESEASNARQPHHPKQPRCRPQPCGMRPNQHCQHRDLYFNKRLPTSLSAVGSFLFALWQMEVLSLWRWIRSILFSLDQRLWDRRLLLIQLKWLFCRGSNDDMEIFKHSIAQGVASAGKHFPLCLHYWSCRHSAHACCACQAVVHTSVC